MEVLLLKICVLLTALLATCHAAPGPPAHPEPRISSSIKEGVIFKLYTRQNEENPEEISIYDLAKGISTSKYFDPSKALKVGIHGWQSRGKSMALLRKAFLEQGDHNVLMVDWRKADNVVYPVVRLKVVQLAKWVSYFLDLLGDLYPINASKVHVVGHSLGAHISGVVGLLQNRRLARITGLDPAGPLFANAPDRLTYEAAKFVDVIHTCGNIFGYMDPLGHADFYPNGGICTQPGCHLDPRPSCSHNRAVDFFAESLTSKSGFTCWPYVTGPEGDFEANVDWAQMGDKIDTSVRGVYYVVTAHHSPYAIAPPKNVTGYFDPKPEEYPDPDRNAFTDNFNIEFDDKVDQFGDEADEIGDKMDESF